MQAVFPVMDAVRDPYTYAISCAGYIQAGIETRFILGRKVFAFRRLIRDGAGDWRSLLFSCFFYYSFRLIGEGD